MTVEFSSQTALFGGSLVGLSTAALWAVRGEHAGVATLVFSLKGASSTDLAWRLVWLAGVVAGGRLAWKQGNVQSPPSLLDAPPASASHFIVAGLLVGVGSRLAGGCFTEHVVCGLARGRAKSYVATAVVLATAVGATTVQRLVGTPAPGALPFFTVAPAAAFNPSAYAPVAGLLWPYLVAYFFALLSFTAYTEALVVNTFLCGGVYGIGLVLSGLASPAKAKALLDVTGRGGRPWDPSLACAFAAAQGVATLGILGCSKLLSAPVGAPSWPAAGANDAPSGRSVYGSALLGLGWAAVGVSAAGGLASLATRAAGGDPVDTALPFVVAMAVGGALAGSGVKAAKRTAKPVGAKKKP